MTYKKDSAIGKGGMILLNRLPDKVRLVNKVMLERVAGIEPVILFPLKANLFKYVKYPMDVGTGPMTLFPVKSRPTTDKLASQTTPNQPFKHGSPLFQFVDLIHLHPFVQP